MSKRVITFGTFDLFHFGHLKILERASELGDHLSVGVSSDVLNLQKKNAKPVYPEQHRFDIVSAIRYVDHVFLEESLELKGKYIEEMNADILVMGSDWEGKFDEFKSICEVVYLKRTDVISTSFYKSYISNNM